MENDFDYFEEKYKGKEKPNYMKYWILVDKEVVECKGGVLEWGRRFEYDNRHVGIYRSCGITVSTVFLGIDHSFGRGAPVLFETMVFGDPREEYEYQARYCTYDEALNGHRRKVHELDIGFPSNYWFKYHFLKLMPEKIKSIYYGNKLIKMFKK